MFLMFLFSSTALSKTKSYQRSSYMSTFFKNGMQKHIARVISNLEPQRVFFPFQISVWESPSFRQNRCRNRRHSTQKKMLSDLIQLFICGEFQSYQKCGSIDTNTKANPIIYIPEKDCKVFPLKTESMNYFIKYVELINCFITVSSQPIYMA